MSTPQRLALALAWPAAVGMACMLAARLVVHDAAFVLVVLNQFSLWLYAAAWPVLALAAWARKPRLAAVVAPVAVWHLWLVVPPLFSRTPPAACGPSLSILSANLLMVNPAPAALAQEIFDADADVVLLQELSPMWEAVLDEQGLFAGWPEGWQVVREDSFGSAIASRLPLDTTGDFELTGLPQTRASLTWEGREIGVLNLHTLPPRTPDYEFLHRAALEDVAADLRARAGRGESFVVGGDLNASPYSRFFVDIADVADDAWDLAGRGFGFTWPNGVFPLPPSRLDHLIVSRDLTVMAIAVGRGEGSDHRPLRVEVAARCR